jgi:predicted ATPase
MGIKLTKVEIHNYRSIFEEYGSPAFAFSLTPGTNALIGANNCGKSNILKAIALALEEGEEGTFVSDRDVPVQKVWARPTITLDFVVERPSSPERTLLKYLDEYERSALQQEPKASLASKGRIRLRVKYTKEGRDEFFITAAGSRRGTPDLNERALNRFRQVVRFVLVRSGESVENFLAGRFRDLLHTVLQENLSEQVKVAESRRLGYQTEVAKSVFGPVSKVVVREIGQIVPEIKSVTIEPRVLGIDESLESAGISIVDGAKTGLAEKGTGVRGTLLLAMLRYIAEHSKRSVIFAVEEPEAFLHPAAQSEVRDDLEKLAERDDVTLLVTTHSPFVISRSSKAQLISLTKDDEGRTRIVECCPGDADRRGALGALFSDSVMPDYLERAAKAPKGARAFLVVEGLTDMRYLELAAERCKCRGVAEGIHIVPCDGARSAAVQAALHRGAQQQPVVCLLDYEELTKRYVKMLKDTFGFRPEEVMTYRDTGADFRDDDIVEAEGLFPEAFLRAFVKKAGEDAVVSEKKQTKRGWRYGFNQAGKDLFLAYVERHAGAAELGRFADVWRCVNERVEKLEKRAARAAALGA